MPRIDLNGVPSRKGWGYPATGRPDDVTTCSDIGLMSSHRHGRFLTQTDSPAAPIESTP